jgi:hypothetical protein
MTDPGSQRSKRMPQNCPTEIADEKPSRRQFLDLKLIDHDSGSNNFNMSSKFSLDGRLLLCDDYYDIITTMIISHFCTR